ncbi:uncharacterized protein LOC133039749 [Cannabis sativa]|uniref:uncharacterized protein LOC133039749 n=1 Tax=Cannabis sativa TaxID=3483 RepID=UPI0029CA02CE|nr:uncharacterized protein LOC133039749 [Cannabis sativa]
MESSLVLSEKERSVHSFSDADLAVDSAEPRFFLVARCLSSSINPKNFTKKMGEFWTNKCRFPVTVSKMHSNLFLLTIGCAGDKLRILNGEPWHYFNQLILLHSPKQLQNVTPDDLFKVQFWVQIHRLPFLSKSRALAMKVGEWIGEYIDVFEDSLYEGWGHFIRIRVMLDITHPLMRGKLVTLPKVRDEHWIEFRYENLHIFCFHCGIIGHPFEKCSGFMELVDAGVDPDLPYGPSMMGDKLPNSGYDRYRSDFSTAKVYPFLTRVAQKSIAAIIPPTNINQHRLINRDPHPIPLTVAENNKLPSSSNPTVEPLPELPQPFPSFFQSAGANSIFCDSTITSVKDKGKSIMIEDGFNDGSSSNKTFKSGGCNPAAPQGAMKIISWNARGLGNPSAFRHLKLLVKQQCPHVLFIMESKLACNSINRVCTVLKFSHGLEVPRQGLRGGLLLLWKDHVDVSLTSFSMNHFDVFVSYDRWPRYHFTAFYGSPETNQRIQTWNLLRSFAIASQDVPWLIMGDFNELLSNDDKEGGPLRREQLMEDFRKSIDDCGVTPLDYTGNKFTWSNKNYNGLLVKERLDRGFINGKWKEFFSDNRIHHLDYYSSDHRAIALNISMLTQDQPDFRPRNRFRFEQFWLKDEECRNLIVNNWKSGLTTDPLPSLLQNINSCSTALQTWHNNKYGQMKHDINKAQKKAAEMHNLSVFSTDQHTQMVNAEKVLDDLLEKEELYWQQRARVDWLKSGDANTKFFHSRAKSRYNNNKIRSLQASDGRILVSDQAFADEASLFFSQLFATSGVDLEALNVIMAAIDTSITEDMNDSLLKTFTGADVDEALKSMAPDKSPGMDGMSAIFFQQHWDIVGPMVKASVLKILNEGADMHDINSALITLIPKVDQPQRLSDYRPISLCSVLYKLVSKAIVARFKKVLPVAISQNQSAFLPGRLITDNVLLAFELVHCLKNKKRGRQSYAALKLDMSKAFDRVEWYFLKAVMLKMGFHEIWVELVMRCVSSSTLSFNINGAIKGLVTPQRRLRQGDPLSPYLFLICSEGLSALLRSEENNGNLKGLSISRGAPSVSHLLFAGDSLLFCHANDSSCQAISRVLDIYHRASGQLLNTDKTVMSFSPNASDLLKNRFHTVLGMPICELHEKYLGLPSYAGRDKSELFSNIKDRIWKLMNAWHAKLFSIGGREVLLKVVVQSIPTYAMSCFSLPKKFCRQLESMMANFWWGSSTNKSKIHWKNWNLLCQSKAEGGMGFRSFLHFNQALLAKQAWRILDDPHSLLARVLKARYFKNGTFLKASKGTLPSLTWQSICDGRELLIKGLRWKIGLGNSVKCVSDPWLSGNTTFRPYTYSGDLDFTVEYYISPDRRWDLNLLRQHFGQIDIDRILSISISPNPREDRLIWHHSDSGFYTVKSRYQLAAQLEKIHDTSTSNSNHSWWNRMWSLNIPKKVKIFAWRVINDAFPTAVNLMHRKISPTATWSLCNCLRESTGHALFHCTRAHPVWSLYHVFNPDPNLYRMNGFEIFSSIALVQQNAEFEKILCLMWCIWTERNKEIHGSKPKPAGVICSFADLYIHQFHRAQLSQAATNSSNLSPTAATVGNSSAAIPSTGSVIGIGAVVRDYFGDVVGAYSKSLLGCYSVKEMEAMAIFHSLKWALQHGLQIDYLETDSLIVATAINKHSAKGNVSIFYDIVDDITLLLSSFPRVLVSHVKRDANKAAHELARFALRLDNDCSWLGEIPSPIHSVIVMDSIQ